MKLSIIIPAYNEETTILTILRKVRAVEIPKVQIEVVVVDDGSSDRTKEIIHANAEFYDVFLPLPENQGKGGAVRAGLKAATGDYVVFQDADLEYDPREIPKLMKPVLDYHASVVFGSRVLTPELVRVHYLWNYLGNRALTWFFNILYNRTFSDVYTCYLLFRRDLINPDALRTNGFEQQAEIICHCLKRAKSVYEVPISYHGRTLEEGKKIRARHAIACFRTILRERILFKKPLPRIAYREPQQIG